MVMKTKTLNNMQKLIIALVVVAAVIIAFFLLNGYKSSEPEPTSDQAIEQDLQMGVDSADSDFMRLDSQIKTL